MAKIIELKEDKLIKGGSKEPVYPITVAKAIYDKKNNNLLDIIDYTLPIEYNTRGVNNNLTLAVLAKVLKVDMPNQRIYLNTNLGKAYNPFVHNDVLIMDEYMEGKLVRHYKFTVDISYFNLEDIYKEDGNINKDRVDWITWKLFIGDPNDIKEGDNLVFRDNLTDINRKGIVTLNTIGNNAPNIEVLRGVETRPDNSLKVRIGNLQGINSPSFGELRDYGLYSTNAYLTGDILLTTGESTETKFKMLDNLLSLSMSKTNYQINEENNILVNCSFSNDFEYWIKSQEELDIYFMQTGESEDDIIPVFMGDNIFSQNFSTIEKVNTDGKEILRLNNASVELLNDVFKDRLPQDNIVTEYIKDNLGNIQYDTDGKTPLTKETLIRPKLYLSYRYMCRDGVPYTENGELVKDTNGNVVYKGKITIGFQNNHNIVYTESMGDTVNLDEMGLVSEITDINDGKWITRQFIAPYDRLGSFIIKAEGDIYIDFFAVTTKPLDNYKDVMTTEFRQTAETIGLYGHRINSLEGSVTDLGIEIDNREEAIKLWALKELYNNDILTTTLNSLFKITPGTITSLTERIDNNEDNILKKYTEVKQDYNGIKTSIYDITYDSEGLEILNIKFYNKTETASYVETLLGDNITPDNPVTKALDNLGKNLQQSLEEGLNGITDENNTLSLAYSLKNARLDIDVLVAWQPKIESSIEDNAKNIEGNLKNIEEALKNVANLIEGLNNLKFDTTDTSNTVSLAYRLSQAEGTINTYITTQTDDSGAVIQIKEVLKSLNTLGNNFDNAMDKDNTSSIAYQVFNSLGSVLTLVNWKTANEANVALISTINTTLDNLKSSYDNTINENFPNSLAALIKTALSNISLLASWKDDNASNVASISTISSNLTTLTNNFNNQIDKNYTGSLAYNIASALGSLSVLLSWKSTAEKQISELDTAVTTTLPDSITLQVSNVKKEINNGITETLKSYSTITLTATEISNKVITPLSELGISINGTTRNIAITATNGTVTFNTDNFKLTSNGTLTATNGNFTGTITATNGNIGGFKITATQIISKDNGLILDSGGTCWFALLNAKGKIVATEGDIGGILINTDSDGGIKSSNGNFYIKSNGYLYCKNADIEGKITATSGSFNGTITATNGNIGGFKITDNLIYSTETDLDGPFLLLYGITGTIVARKADISGKITATEGSFKNGTIENCTINTCTITKGCSITNDNGWNLYGDSTGPGWILDGVGIYNVSLKLRYTPDGNNLNITRSLYLNNGADNAYMFLLEGSNGLYVNATTAMNITGTSTFNGNVSLLGDITKIKGLRVTTSTISSNTSISTSADFITFTNSSAITVGLPSASGCAGKILFLKRTGTGGVTLSGSTSNYIIEAGGTGKHTSREYVGTAKAMIYISNGTYWIEFYCG